MAILPEGFALPPLPYLVVLLAGAAAVAGAAARRRPTVDGLLVVAFTPWMVLGSASHVLYVAEALPDAVRPLAGTPSVYLTVGIVAAATWLALDGVVDGGDSDAVARPLAGVGTALALAAVGAVLLVGTARGSLAPVAPGAGLVVALLVGGAAWAGLVRVYPPAAVTLPVGALAVLGHALDAVSTAVGVDLLGFGERTPLSRIIIEFAAGLPTAPVLGTVWLFVVVKLAVACGVVALFADYVREEPAEANLLLGVVAAVGLGPGVHNLLLFTIVRPA
jgi:uncharacterized membrane protein